jgi:hypothetical protein
MAGSIFIKYVEIPVRVFATHQKAEPSSGFYPGCPEAWGIERIEICNYDDPATMASSLEYLTDSILTKLEDDFASEAPDHQ